MKFKVNENSNKYRRVKRALFGDPTGKIKTFAIISTENPLGWKDCTDEEIKKKYSAWLQNKSGYNKKATKELSFELMKDKIEKTGNSTLRFGHFNYVKIKGTYGNKENTFMIFNLALTDAKHIASAFGQESFFYGKTNTNEQQTSKIAYYFTKNNSCSDYKLVDISNTITFEDDAEDFFSKYGFKYRINMKEFGDDVLTIENNDEFEESLNEDRTFMSRATHRRKAYNKELN